MTTGEKRCDWWNVLLGDGELFTDVQLPAHITDHQFISLLQRVFISISTIIQLEHMHIISIMSTMNQTRKSSLEVIPTTSTLVTLNFDI